MKRCMWAPLSLVLPILAGCATDRPAPTDAGVLVSPPSAFVATEYQKSHLVNLIVLELQSCTANVPEMATKTKWDECLAGPYAKVTFNPPRNLKIAADSDPLYNVTEILHQVSQTQYPPYIFVRNPDGIHAYSKYPSEKARDVTNAITEGR